MCVWGDDERKRVCEKSVKKKGLRMQIGLVEETC